MSEEQPRKVWTWAWAALVAVLVPIGALVAKDIYDFTKAYVEPAKPKPTATGVPVTPTPQQGVQGLGSGALLGKLQTLVPQPGEAADKASLKEAAIKLPVPLIMASRNGQIRVVRLLIDRGADVNAREKETETTALIAAAQQGHAEVVAVLLDRGADVHAKDKAGKTALSEAKHYNHEHVAKLLQERGAAE
ncbi:MAG: ankyrin repeat domain-containing protein [Thermodesulfobacteriota bacterium]